MKKVIITGVTGMVGSLVLKYCLASEEIANVVVLSRKPVAAHPKITQEVIRDFSEYAGAGHLFEGVDVAFFCIGAYTGQVPDDQFRKVTVDYPVEFAKVLLGKSPDACLCLLSGAGADRTEKSRMAFAKYKGMAENKLSAMGLGAFHTFRLYIPFHTQERTQSDVLHL